MGNDKIKARLVTFGKAILWVITAAIGIATLSSLNGEFSRDVEVASYDYHPDYDRARKAK